MKGHGAFYKSSWTGALYESSWTGAILFSIEKMRLDISCGSF